MKKWQRKGIILVILVIVVAFVVIRAEKRSMDRPPKGSKYVVKVSENPVNSSSGSRMTLAFDKHGNLLMSWDGVARVEYTYDAQGRILTQYGYDGMGMSNEMCDYIYDEAGRLIKVEGYYFTKEYHTFWYDYTYDDQGNLTGKMYYSDRVGNKKLDEVTLCEEWSYSPEGYLLKRTDYLAQMYYNYFYDDLGRLKQRTLKGEKKDYSCVFTYDDEGHLAAHSCRKNGELYQHVEFTYDDQGNLYSSDEHRRVWIYVSYDKLQPKDYYKRYIWSYDARGLVTGYSYGSNKSWRVTYQGLRRNLPQTVMDQVKEYTDGFLGIHRCEAEAYFDS